MELRYMGFEQTRNTRCYRFDRLVKGEPSVRLIITADLTLFLAHRIQIQEGPSLCADKLAADLAQSRMGEHQLTSDDLIAHLESRGIAAVLKGESRGGSRNRSMKTSANA